MTNLYFELLKYPVFSIEQVSAFYENSETARSALKALIRKGLVYRIRNQMYTCKSGESGGPVANKYQIGSAVDETAYISHHSALEYHGYQNQVYNEVYVSSAKNFREFDFDGIRYKCVKSGCEIGIEKPAFGGGVKVTDLERSLIDSLKDISKISGIEEIADIITTIPSLEEEKLTKVLDRYDNQFLYQKAGFFLSRYYQGKLSEAFYSHCRNKAAGSKRYLEPGTEGVYVGEWQIIVPRSMIRTEVEIV